MRQASGAFVAFILFIFCTCGMPDALADDHDGNRQKAILVTGASTGIGRRIAEDLAANGYFVYAGARKQDDLDALSAIENIQGVRLDVTVQDDIDAAVKTVLEDNRGLYGLVNNAGIYIGGPMIELDVSELEWQMNVNVYGVYRVTQAFAPLLIASKGRIVNIGSISGILSSRFSGPYSMSKHAIEAYTDSLAAEVVDKFGIQVSVVEPGNYDSEIAHTALQRFQDKGYAQDDSLYAEEMGQFVNRSGDRSRYKGPEEVAEAVMHALFDSDPLRRYMVVPNEQEAGLTIDKAMQELVQLNQYQAYSFSREELIEKLDAALQEAGASSQGD